MCNIWAKLQGYFLNIKVFQSLESIYGSIYCLDISKSHKVTAKIYILLWIIINTLKLRTFEMAAIVITYILIMLRSPTKTYFVKSSQEAVFYMITILFTQNPGFWSKLL